MINLYEIIDKEKYEILTYVAANVNNMPNVLAENADICVEKPMLIIFIYVKYISYIISCIGYIMCVHYIICVAYVICVVLFARLTEVLHRES